MLAQLSSHPHLPAPEQLARISHLLAILPVTSSLPVDCPAPQELQAALARRHKGIESLAKTPISASLPNGGLVVWCMLEENKPRFEQFTHLRKAIHILLEEQPAQLDILVAGDSAFCQQAGEMATYVALANGTPLPTLKQKDVPKALETLTLWGSRISETPGVLAEANLLARTFTALPPNILTPGAYRERLREMAADLDWQIDEYDSDRLRDIGAGAFLAVASGSDRDDAAIVRLSYQPKKAKREIALVGKGICFDTGGHNLKPAKYMAGMHEDMSGSAVALGILLAASRLHLPVRIELWLALAQNEISPQAYRQGDVITALDGTTIEIVHTDAEGRMVLADTLALASREKPDLLIDFATLTGSMITALGTRYAGAFSCSAPLAELALAAGRESGERLCIFPMDEDYEEELDSTVADIKQCTLESDADHILAACFLKRFVGETPWLHVDLSTASCKGGLGALGTPQTGFGVAWGVEFIRRWLEEGNKLSSTL
ncbi:MAG: leucyl aminopeptidase [Proteobacteria bacterium]|nr:leucyl aminopeptidase [Pseudomonadota bacterium]